MCDLIGYGRACSRLCTRSTSSAEMSISSAHIYACHGILTRALSTLSAISVQPSPVVLIGNKIADSALEDFQARVSPRRPYQQA